MSTCVHSMSFTPLQANGNAALQRPPCLKLSRISNGPICDGVKTTLLVAQPCITLASSIVHQQFLLASDTGQPPHMNCNADMYTHEVLHIVSCQPFFVHPCFASQTCTTSMHVTEAVRQNIVPNSSFKLSHHSVICLCTYNNHYKLKAAASYEGRPWFAAILQAYCLPTAPAPAAPAAAAVCLSRTACDR